jgi:hypothetical protein
MSHSLSISNSGLTAHAPKKAMKKAAKRAAKKAVGHHPPKKHVGPGHEHKDRHEAQTDHRRAYLHLSRAASLLALLPQNNALNALKRLYSLCRELFDANSTSPKAVAEFARALEHLCFTSLAAVHSSSVSEHHLTKEQKRDFGRHFQHDFEKQKEHLEETEAIFSQRGDKRQSTENGLLDLARHSLATAERMLQKEDWHLAHEYLRATDALIKNLDDPS